MRYLANLWVMGLSIACASAYAQTAEELISAGKNPDNVPLQGMGYDLRNYSALKQINRSNVKRLVPVWSMSLSNESGELAQPTVYNGVMYVINAKQTFAIDVATGRQIWRTEAYWPPEAAAEACCGVVARGAATIYNGKLFRVTLDNHVLALDMKTGKEVWNQKFAEYKDGYTATSAPLIANGILITGMAGGEFTTRGFLNGWDPDTGKHLWTRYTVPAPGEPGSESWPDTDAWKYGGAPTWRSGAYDPGLDLAYWGTGNPAPWPPDHRNGLDALYSNSLLALRPETGEIVWYYQYTPNDSWDLDGTDEPVMADIKYEGTPRKVLFQVNKNGFIYTIDRTNGRLLAAHPFTRVNWASRIDLTTGRPVINSELYEKMRSGEEVQIYPQRAINAIPAAYNPNTGLIYTSSWDLPRNLKIAPLSDKPQVIGQRSIGVVLRPHVPVPGEVVGHYLAIDPLTGIKKWEIPLIDRASSAGMLATGGGLLFTGSIEGKFIALDQQTGKILWQFQTSSSVNATAITYTYKGRQYVSIASGLGGNSAVVMARGNVPLGGSMWTFALMKN
jgi:alcohol dehydrogenase (cytochrome c)